MYESYFQFTQPPFSIAPDPAFLYLSDGHREALAHLLYGFSNGGFVLVTGEVGTGKTTLLRSLVRETPEKLDVAFILNPRLTVRELLETLCDELGVVYPEGAELSVKQYIDALNRHLLQSYQNGRDTVVIIDEAQNLSAAVLEQIRLLTNLETDKRKLLRIILLGQPELAELLARKELRQLAQRITARYHLGTLNREDTYAYVIHRLSRAGGNPQIFTRRALRRLYRISRGTPRIINLVADRALLGAYVEGKRRVGARLVTRAAREVLSKPSQTRKWVITGLLAASAAGMAWAYFTIPERQSNGAGASGQPPTSRTEAPAPALSVDGPTEPKTVATTKSQTTAEPDPTTPGVTPDRVAEPPHEAPATKAAGEPEAPPPAGSPDPVILPDQVTTQPAPPTTASATPVELPEMDRYVSQHHAYARVFERWGIDFEATRNGMIPCNFAPTAGLQCLTQTGTWSDIRRLNLPVVIELFDAAADSYQYAAVTAIRGEAITLHLGNEVLQVTDAALGDIWFGKFVVLWRMPPNYRGNLKRGDRHPSVSWLRHQLEDLSEKSLGGGNDDLFDENLYDAVLQFQSDEQLNTDGVVGPATWIRLASRLDLPSPDLTSDGGT